MVVINTKTNEAHFCSQSEAARLIGVNRSTIHRWRKQASTKPIQQYNSFTVYFKTVKHKQQKGKPKPPPRTIQRQGWRRP
jgi:transposase-like protein